MDHVEVNGRDDWVWLSTHLNNIQNIKGLYRHSRGIQALTIVDFFDFFKHVFWHKGISKKLSQLDWPKSIRSIKVNIEIHRQYDKSQIESSLKKVM